MEIAIIKKKKDVLSSAPATAGRLLGTPSLHIRPHYYTGTNILHNSFYIQFTALTVHEYRLWILSFPHQQLIFPLRCSCALLVHRVLCKSLHVCL
jgi:hypothetical protein